MRRWLVLLLLLLGLASRSEAATVNASACTPAAVNTAISAAAPGDTVQLPTCSGASWDGILTITKRITLQGNGTANTILSRTAFSMTFGDAMIRVNGVTGFVAKDFAINGTADTNPTSWADSGIRLTNCVDFRITNLLITFIATGIYVDGDPTVMRGVIDNNTITDTPNTGPSNTGYGVVVFGNGTFPPLELGTAQNVFVEHNTFARNKEAMDSNNGARYVFRNNQVGDLFDVNQVAVHTHGFASWPRGTRQFEVYDNIITVTVATWTGIGSEGGDGVVFNNQIDSQFTNKMYVNNTNCSGTYPQQDQTTAAYFWNNTVQPGGATATVSNQCSSLLQLNRDYFTTPMPGYTAYTYPHPLTITSVPPTITITTNCGGGVGGNCTVTTSPLTTLAGTASDDVSVSSVTWSCDVCGSGTATGTTSWSVASIALMPGSNVLTVTATDGDALQATDTITVTYNAPDDYATGLLMHLPFENGSGTTASDISGNGHPGTLVGGATWTTGKVGTFAVTLNGTTQQVNVTGLLGTPGAVTLAAWVNLTALPDTSNNVVTLGDYAIVRQTATALECAYYYGANWQTTSAAASLVGAGWHHLVCTFAPGAQAVYLDGVSVATGSSANSQVWTGRGSDTVLGNHGFGGANHLQGSLDSVRVYGRALRSGDVAALYLAENQAPTAPTVLRLVK